MKWYEDPVYIRMCDCPEIQDIFKGFDLKQFPNYAYDKVTERVSIIFWSPNKLKGMVGNKGNVLIVSIESDREKNQYVSDTEYDGDFCTSVIWLPTQDKLQEMVKSTCPLDLLNRFYRWCDATDIAGYDDSMEQLWLAFYMKEKHNKKWDGEKWIQQRLI